MCCDSPSFVGRVYRRDENAEETRRRSHLLIMCNFKHRYRRGSLCLKPLAAFG
jgi:hypothetical protein